MNNKSQLESVIGELKGQNSKELEAQRAAIDKQIVDMIVKQTAMDPEDIIRGLSKRKRTAKSTPIQKNTANKVGNVNSNFYANAVSVSKPKLRTGDSVANVGAKIYAVMKQDIEDRKLNSELAKNREKEQFDEEKRRNEELIATIEKAKKGVKAQKPKKELPPRDEKGRFIKKEPAPPKAGAPAPKPAEVKPSAQKPVSEAPAKPPTAKPAAEPSAKPSVSKEAPSVPRVATSAAKISTGTKGLVLSALIAAGYSKSAQANILANVEEESGFVPQTETVGKYTGDNLYQLYGKPDDKFTLRYGKNKGKTAIANPASSVNGKHNKVRFNSPEEADAVVKQGPEAVAEVIYGGRMGNDQPGDGAKYIGRGFIQLTGKENYAKVSQMLFGDDRLVKNPELANDPKIAADIIPAYMKIHKRSAKDLENIDVAIKAVGTGSKHSEDLRRELAKKYNSELASDNNMGSQLDQSSRENKDLKSSDKGTNIIIDNTKTNILTSGGSSPQTIRTATPLERPAIIGG